MLVLVEHRRDNTLQILVSEQLTHIDGRLNIHRDSATCIQLAPIYAYQQRSVELESSFNITLGKSYERDTYQ